LEKDLLILSELRQNARETLTKMSKHTGIPISTIFDKIKQLNIEKEIIFTDYVNEEDLPYLYNLASALILVSLYEGFGLSPLQAMACGTPVVTSNTSSMPEVVGDAGILVDPQSPENIAAGIITAVKNCSKVSSF